MTQTTLTIRPPVAADSPAWRALWDGYCVFYAATVPDEVTQATWARLLDPAVPVHGLVAERDGALIGMLTYILHPGTWSLAPVAYLEDLFVAPQTRGGGVGRALIAALADLGRREGWRRIYWQTAADNATAQALYDKVATRTNWVRYDLDLEP